MRVDVDQPLENADWPKASPSRRRIRDVAATAAAVDFTEGSMICLYVPPDVADGMAVRDGQPAETLHVTLAFLPDGVADPEALVEKLWDAGEWADLEGTFGGLGMFAPGENGTPVIALVDVPGLAELRERVVELLADEGVTVADNHGYVPHVTLGYDDLVVDPTKILGVPLHFTHLSLSAGPERWDVPLGSAVVAAAPLTWKVQWRNPEFPGDRSRKRAEAQFLTEAEALAFRPPAGATSHVVTPSTEPPGAYTYDYGERKPRREQTRLSAPPSPPPPAGTTQSWEVITEPELPRSRGGMKKVASFRTEDEARFYRNSRLSAAERKRTTLKPSTEPPFAGGYDWGDEPQGRYSDAEGGHPKGWGLGPAYQLRDDQVVGRPGGVSQVKGFDESKHPRNPATGRDNVRSPSDGGKFRAKVGVTPYRPEDDPAGFYDTDKAREFERSVDQFAAENGVTVDAGDRVQGFWQGEQEPSYALDVHDGEAGVNAFAADLRAEWDQDAVMLFSPDRDGPDLAYRAQASGDIANALTQAGVEGATIYAGGFEVYGDADSAAKVLAAADILGVPHQAVTVRAGSLSFVERGK
jgi:hypothetical protein